MAFPFTERAKNVNSLGLTIEAYFPQSSVEAKSTSRVAGNAAELAVRPATFSDTLMGVAA